MKPADYNLNGIDYPFKKRITAELISEKEGPAIVLCGAVHGNEPSGVVAIHNVINYIRKKNIPFRGTLLCMLGNMKALNRNVRFVNMDMNRLWSKAKLSEIFKKQLLQDDEKELKEVYQTTQSFCQKAEGKPRFFIDLHTTSSESIPFIFVDHDKKNKTFAQKLPVPSVEGINDYLKGAMVNYTTNAGFISVIFEGGQHQCQQSIKKHEAFIWLALAEAGFISKKVINFEKYYHFLHSQSNFPHQNFLIAYRHQILGGEKFRMNNGYQNFDSIQKGEMLAINEKGKIESPVAGRIFLPLYQTHGNDGFFIVH